MNGRRGVTLVELLVVVGLILILLFVAARRLPLAMEGRRIREASRAATVFLGKARSHAMQTRRSHGVLFEPFERQREASIVLREVETPHPYAGDLIDAVVRVQIIQGFVRVQIRANDMAPGLIRRGDVFRLNYQGPHYTIVDDLRDNSPPGDPSPPAGPGNDFPLDATGFIDFATGVDADRDGWFDNYWLTLELPSSGPRSLPWPNNVTWTGTPELPFQIFRQPVPTAAEPLQLPRETVIDLASSGTNSMPFGFPLCTKPVMVMFSPNGGIDRLYFSPSGNIQDYAGQRVTEPLYFLVGKWERMRLPPVTGSPKAEDGLENWEDANNLWVALNAQTGLVTVAELHADLAPGAPGNPNPTTYVPSDVYAARKFAREAQIAKGGR